MRWGGRRSAGGVGAAVCLAAAIGSAVALLGPPPPASRAQAPTATAAPSAACEVNADKTVAPDVLLLGETATITLRVRADCRSDGPLSLVLVLDASASMAGERSRAMKDAMTQLVRDLDLESHPQRLVAVVEFNSTAGTLCSLTNDTSSAVACIRQVRASGGTDIAAGILDGIKVLARRGHDPSAPDPREVMIVLTDGNNNRGCPPVLSAATMAKSQDILVVAGCLGPDCDAACMRAAATSPNHFFAAPGTGDVLAVVVRLRRDVLGVGLSQLTVSETLAPNMRYVPDSAQPVPGLDDGVHFEWRAADILADGLTFTLQVRPLEPGYWPTNAEARLSYVTASGARGAAAFPVPHITVLEPGRPETPTAPPAPTVTPRATPEPPTPGTGPSPTAAPSPTPTRLPRPLHLPIAHRT